jgi:hypothetical protein
MPSLTANDGRRRPAMTGRPEFPDGAAVYLPDDAWPLVTVRFPDGGQADSHTGSKWYGHVRVRYCGLEVNGLRVDVDASVNRQGSVTSLWLSKTGVAGADGGTDVPAKVREKVEALCRRRAREARAAAGVTAGRARPRQAATEEAG